MNIPPPRRSVSGTSTFKHLWGTLCHAFRAEFLLGRTTFDWAFLFAGLLVQVVVFCVQPDGWLSFVSGMTGIISVILCSQGKISTFFFGFIQIITYLCLSFSQRLYGEVAVNAFYFLSQLYGIYIWGHRYHINTTNSSAELRSKCLTRFQLICLTVFTIICSVLVGWCLECFTDDTQPWLDAFTTVPALCAQLLLVMAYREQWLFWLAVDVLSAVMWARAGDWCLLAQYIFWCVNCLYGLRRWTRIAEPA